MRKHLLLSLALAAAAGTVPALADDAPDLPSAIVQRCKNATALVGLGPNANFDDCPVKVGDRAFRSSELLSIEQKPDAEKKTTKVTTTVSHFDPPPYCFL